MPHLPDHQTDHDPLLIAAYAAGDAEATELERAQSLVATCDDCAALHHDLRAISSAMPALPAATRGRDFRLTREQADELRPTGWRRLLAPLAGPRFAFAAPLGGSLAALGLAGILVAGAASTPIVRTGSGGGGGTGATVGAAGGAASSGAGTSGGAPNQADRAASAASVAPDVEALAGSPSQAAPSGDAYLAAPAPAESAIAVAPPGAAGGAAGVAGTGPAASDTTGSARDGVKGYAAASPGLGAQPDLPSAAAVAGPLAESTAPPAPAAGLPAAVVVVSVLLVLAGVVILGLRLAARRTSRVAG
jgi:hypothetical protein